MYETTDTENLSYEWNSENIQTDYDYKVRAKKQKRTTENDAEAFYYILFTHDLLYVFI